jgi:hypothetical protein
MTEFVRNALVEIQFRVLGVRVGVALGPRGIVVALQRGDRRWLLIIGRVR